LDLQLPVQSVPIITKVVSSKKYLILEQSGNQKAKKNCLVIMNFNKGQFYGKKILQNVLSEIIFL
jgi:hypothetical protein